MHSQVFSRNIGVIGKAGQERLRKCRVAIIGFGGVGQAAFVNLLRAGVGSFAICDPDEFEISNLNRQALSSLGNLGEGKAKSAIDFAKGVNPDAKVRAHAWKFSVKNSGKILLGCDIVLDGLDNFKDRVALHSECMKMKIPYVFASASGACGMCSVFEKKKEGRAGGKGAGLQTDFRKIFGRAGKFAKKCDSIIAPAAYLAGSLAAAQGTAVVLGKKRVSSPDFLFFDLFSKNPVQVKRIA